MKNSESSGSWMPELLALPPQDRHPGLEIRHLHLRDQAPFEARNQALLQVGDLAHRPVAGHHDLLLVFVERIEGVEEFLLGAFLARQEMDVVDQQQVDVAVFPPEGRQFVLLQRLDELVGERLARGVAHRAFAALQHRLPHRLDQMRLAQPGAAVDEQRIVGAPGRIHHRQSRRMRERIRRPHHEVVERVPRIERPAHVVGFQDLPLLRLSFSSGSLAGTGPPAAGGNRPP